MDFRTQVLPSLPLLLLLFLIPSRTPQPPIPTQQQPPRSNQSLSDLFGNDLISRLHALSEHTDPVPKHLLHAAVTRPFLSRSAASARTLLHTYMLSAGLSPRTDPAGNVIGDLRCPHRAPRKSLAMGSHYDSVTLGGMWDGAYGVLAAISVAHILSSRPGGVCALPFDIRVLAFDDEEGNSQWSTTNFGSKAYAGVLNTDSIPDFSSLAEKYLQIYPQPAPPSSVSVEKFVADRIHSAKADPGELVGFIELHIEQGPVLQTNSQPVGIVNAIAGQTRFLLFFSGKSGHAGTVPMRGRRDALSAAAEAVLAIEAIGISYADQSLVTTVGTLAVSQGSSNVIPGRVSFSVDLRAPSDNLRRKALEEILERANHISHRRNVHISNDVLHDIDAVPMTPWLMNVLEYEDCCSKNSTGFDEEAENAQLNGVCNAPHCRDELLSLTSGAGHDTQFMSKITDVAMIFVRCRDGISHHPDEHVSDEDAFTGTHTLLRMVDATARYLTSQA